MGICFGKPAKCAHATTTNIFADDGSKFHGKEKESATSGEQHGRSSRNGKQSWMKTEFSLPTTLKPFSFNDLKNATRNFRSDSLIGEGGFGWVFKGWIDENTYTPTKPGSGRVVAVKMLKQESFQGHREWLAEVNYLGQFHHENLVKLIGYCSESENRLLVYEFMQKGSLENHLFRKGVQPISWDTMMNIAIDIARVLTFLHSFNKNVIYRDLKASNILLDSDFNAKLEITFMYPPESSEPEVMLLLSTYQQGLAFDWTGHLTPKSDVYSFGVLLLELLTGKPAMEDGRGSHGEETLAAWAEPFLRESRRVLRIMDTRLGGEYSKKSAQAAAALALQCLSVDPKNRPVMSAVLTTLEKLHASNTIPRRPCSSSASNPNYGVSGLRNLQNL